MASHLTNNQRGIWGWGVGREGRGHGGGLLASGLREKTHIQKDCHLKILPYCTGVMGKAKNLLCQINTISYP